MKINVAFPNQFDLIVAAPHQEHGQHQEEEEGGGCESGGLDTSKGGQLKMEASSYVLQLSFSHGPLAKQGDVGKI